MKKTTEIKMASSNIIVFILLSQFFHIAFSQECTIEGQAYDESTGRIDHTTVIKIPKHHGYYLNQMIILEVPYNDTSSVYLTHTCSVEDDRSYMDVSFDGEFFEDQSQGIAAVVDRFLSRPIDSPIRNASIDFKTIPPPPSYDPINHTESLPTPDSYTKVHTITQGDVFNLDDYINNKNHEANKISSLKRPGRSAVAHEVQVGGLITDTMRARYRVNIFLENRNSTRLKRSIPVDINLIKKDIDEILSKRIDLYEIQITGIKDLIAGNILSTRSQRAFLCRYMPTPRELMRCVTENYSALIRAKKLDIVITLLGDYLTRISKMIKEIELRNLYRDSL